MTYSAQKLMADKLLKDVDQFSQTLKGDEYSFLKSSFNSILNEETFLKNISDFVRLKLFLDQQYSKNIIKLIKVFSDTKGLFDFVKFFCVDYLKKLLSFYQNNVAAMNKMLIDITEMNSRQKKKIKSKNFKEFQSLYNDVLSYNNAESNYKKKEDKYKQDKSKEKKKMNELDNLKSNVNKKIDQNMMNIANLNGETFIDLKNFLHQFLLTNQIQFDETSQGLVKLLEKSNQLDFQKCMNISFKNANITKTETKPESKTTDNKKEGVKHEKNSESVDKNDSASINSSNAVESALNAQTDSLFDSIKKETNMDKFYSDDEEDEEEQTSKINIVIKPLKKETTDEPEEDLHVFAANLRLFSDMPTSNLNSRIQTPTGSSNGPAFSNASSFQLQNETNNDKNPTKHRSLISLDNETETVNVSGQTTSIKDIDFIQFMQPSPDTQPTSSRQFPGLPLSKPDLNFQNPIVNSTPSLFATNFNIESQNSLSSIKKVDCPISFAFIETVNAECFSDKTKNDDISIFGTIGLSISTEIISKINTIYNNDQLKSKLASILTIHLDNKNNIMSKIISSQPFISVENEANYTKLLVDFSRILVIFEQNPTLKNTPHIVLEAAKYSINLVGYTNSNFNCKSVLPIMCSPFVENSLNGSYFVAKSKFPLKLNHLFIPKSCLTPTNFYTIDLDVIYQIGSATSGDQPSVLFSSPTHESWDPDMLRLLWSVDQISVDSPSSMAQFLLEETLLQCHIGNFKSPSKNHAIGLKFILDESTYYSSSISFGSTNDFVQFSVSAIKQVLKSGRYIIHG